jgi:ketosteroid isomerase-like protein
MTNTLRVNFATTFTAKSPQSAMFQNIRSRRQLTHCQIMSTPGLPLKGRLWQTLAITNCFNLRTTPMFINRVAAPVLVASLGLHCAMPVLAGPESAREQVWAAELAFARTMAERKLPAFAEFIADEAVFFSGTTALRGKAKVIADWASYFTSADLPFSWEPDQIEVLASGTLALSTGPVRDPSGKIIARFNSIWRLEAPNVWRVVFDKGSPPSPSPK